MTLEDLNNFATSLKREIQLPSRNWQFIVEANIKALVCLSITINANGVVTTKSLSINLNKTIYASYNGLPLHNITPKELLDSKQISLFLTKLESFHPCRGVVGSLVDVTANPNLEVVGSRSANCDIIIGKGKSCLNCKKLTKTSKRKLAQIKSLREQLQLQKRDLFVCNKNILVRLSFYFSSNYLYCIIFDRNLKKGINLSKKSTMSSARNTETTTLRMY